MSTRAGRILRAAADLVGGMPELAVRLGTNETILAQYMVGHRRVPDPLLLEVLDLMLAERDRPALRRFTEFPGSL
ncbi:MAG TPA: hypothetical protein VHN19_08930 [Burkholderiales bacterium]|jgi:hypothetical protein|nr:hypothetical protein [Burkholderiales bacterium]HEX2650043.1 hypothetical protein [Burkholderiales bacterium]